jgi:hypothetical protein
MPAEVKETLNNYLVVIPAKAGNQSFKDLDARLRGHDELIRPSLNNLPAFIRPVHPAGTSDPRPGVRRRTPHQNV